MFDADQACYLTEAEKCRWLAAQAVDPIDKDALQQMADEWLTLARASPKQRQRRRHGVGLAAAPPMQPARPASWFWGKAVAARKNAER